MNPSVPNTLGRALRGFFADHLPRVRGASPQTVQSYRDIFVLLLRFVASQQRKSVIDLDVGDLGPQVVLDFLQHLESSGTMSPRPEMFALRRFMPSFATVLRSTRTNLSCASTSWQCLSSAHVPALSSTSNSRRSRRFSRPDNR